jgi:hypothetical protein
VDALLIAAAAFLVILGGAGFGTYLQKVLPEHHLNQETRDAIRIGIGLIATMAALVLGLLLASAKGSFDTKSDEVRMSAAHVILLDRNLRQYGPDADGARQLLREALQTRLHVGWVDTARMQVVDPTTGPLSLELLQERLRDLAPSSPAQRLLQARALQLAGDLAQTRWLLVEQIGGSIPIPFLVLLVLWLAIIFASIGLFAPRNATVYAVEVVCALSVASALFLIIEMDRPFGGLLHISDLPLRTALEYLSR